MTGGLEKAYVHLDGWEKQGMTENTRIFCLPVKKREVRRGSGSSGECRALGYRFALHDQYQDYYTDADTYDQSQAVMLPDGSRPGECTWTGESKAICVRALHHPMCAGITEGLKNGNLSGWSISGRVQCDAPG